MSKTENCGEGREMTFEEICGSLRTQINGNGVRLLELSCHKVFNIQEKYIGQHGEMKANIKLAYRHLEDARMRIGKILQAADDGVSILDKPPYNKEQKR